MRVPFLDKLVKQRQTKAIREQGTDANAKLIESINKDHALVVVGNKATIMRFQPIPLDDGSYVPGFTLWNVETFRLWLATLPPIPIGPQSFTTAANYWLESRQRREYHSIEFAPGEGKGREGHYNLWQGFAVRPSRQGSCEKFLAHIRDNVARGNEEHFRWIVGWWAAIFQRPDIKTGTALVVRGKRGTGKSKLGEVFGRLLGEHYLQVVNSRYLVGNFNSHLASLLVLHADEAFWAGDKASVGVLNHLVTGTNLMLEFKGVNPIRIRSFIRLYVCGNPDWIVPSGMRERRWGIFDIGEDHIQDHAYFAAIDDEMNNGGLEALLRHLLDFNLNSVDLRSIPKTEALRDQAIEGLTTLETWWLAMLSRGMLPLIAELHNTCVKTALHESYVAHAKRQNESHRSSETKLGLFLKKMFQQGDQSLLREFRDNTKNCFGRIRRPLCLEFPPLRACRKLFEEQLGQPMDWGSDWETQEWQTDNPWPDAAEKKPETKAEERSADHEDERSPTLN
jgi:hypothetical protein